MSLDVRRCSSASARCESPDAEVPPAGAASVSATAPSSVYSPPRGKLLLKRYLGLMKALFAGTTAAAVHALRVGRRALEHARAVHISAAELPPATADLGAMLPPSVRSSSAPSQIREMEVETSALRSSSASSFGDGSLNSTSCRSGVEGRREGSGSGPPES